MTIFRGWWVCCGCLLAVAVGRAADEQDESLQTLLNVGQYPAGEPAVSAAWRQVAAWDVNRLSEVLTALDQADPVARNWLRSAIDGILEKSTAPLPKDVLQRIVADPSRGLASRRVAWELLESVDAELVASLIPSFLHDPAAEFRRPAVAHLLAQADALPNDPQKRKELLLKAFDAARSEDQVTAIAKSLAALGESVDLAEHFGFVRTWHIIGPFENQEMTGFDHPNPIEALTLEDFDAKGKPLPADAENQGINGPVQWQTVQAKPDTGEVDLNAALGKLKGVLAYGAAVFDSSESQAVELRLRLQNPFKIWVNGQLVLAQRVGHTGNAFDQYRVPVQLRAGRNVLIVKACQPEPPQDNEWYDTWHWSVRVCDSTGTAIGGKK